MTIDTITKPDERTKLEPPKRWQNWWRTMPQPDNVVLLRSCKKCGGNTPSVGGELFSGCCVCGPVTYPSKEVAEIAAGRQIEGLKDILEYVGAYRESERP